MIKSFILKRMTLILLGIGLLAGSSAAQSADAGKIGFVDIEEVTQKANFIKNMLSGIEATAAEKQKSLENKQAEYDRIRKDLQAKGSVSSESQQESLRKQARDILNQIDEETFQLNNYLKKSEKEKMGPALERILETVKTIGTEDGFALVLRGETILYGAPSVDITQKVIDRLNRDAVSGSGNSSNTSAESKNSKDKEAEKKSR